MRKLLAALAVALMGLAIYLGLPVSRADLGITAANSGPQVCRAPTIPDLRYEVKTNCADPKGCPHTERISKEFLPYALASLKAYDDRKRFQLTTFDPTWKLVRQFSHWNGLHYEVYQRSTATQHELLVAFRGTDTVAQIVPVPSDFIANLSWVTQYFNPWDQYRMARAEFRELRDKAIVEAKGKPVSFATTGHSLGGGLAQHIAAGFPCVTAVTFNPSCVVNDWRFSAPFTNSQIVSVQENNDWLTGMICRPGSLLGWNARHHEYEANWVRDRPKDFADEIEIALNQHSIGRLTQSMTRKVVCCAQRAMHSSHPGCSCNADVLSSVEAARRVFCEGRKASVTMQAGHPCNPAPIVAKDDPKCSQRC